MYLKIIITLTRRALKSEMARSGNRIQAATPVYKEPKCELKIGVAEMPLRGLALLHNPLGSQLKARKPRLRRSINQNKPTKTLKSEKELAHPEPRKRRGRFGSK